MAKAETAYKGHRAKAMGHVRSAIRIEGGKDSSFKKRSSKPETKGDSDTKMRMAQQVLQHSQTGLKPESWQHIDQAISEIDAALSGN